MSTIPLSTQQYSAKGVPWYVWFGALAVTSASVGGAWDVSWHRSIGRDTFWTPAHLAIQACGVIAAFICSYLILVDTFGKSEKLRAASLDVKIVSPPHTLLILGMRAVSVGVLFLILAAMNRASSDETLSGQHTYKQ